MMKRIAHWFCLFFLINMCILPISVHAAPVDTEREGSITLYYSQDGNGFGDLEIAIYRVAEASEDGSFDLIAPFSSYPVNIHGITSQKEWQMTAETMTAYLVAGQVEPDHVARTNAEGTVKFEHLQTGLYLVMEEKVQKGNATYVFEDFFLYLPTPMENGEHRYDLEAKPKCSKDVWVPDDPDNPDDPDDPGDRLPDGDIPKDGKNFEMEYSVVKLWKDSGSTEKRPERVTVSILKDGILQEQVALNAENNWSYAWSAPKNSGKWLVVENDVPEGYGVVITEHDRTFTITNSRDAMITDIPKTGDTFLFWPVILVLCISGMVLMLIGTWSRRKE